MLNITGIIQHIWFYLYRRIFSILITVFLLLMFWGSLSAPALAIESVSWEPYDPLMVPPQLTQQFLSDFNYSGDRYPETQLNGLLVTQIQTSQQRYPLFAFQGTMKTGGEPFCGDISCGLAIYAQVQDRYQQLLYVPLFFGSPDIAQQPVLTLRDEQSNQMPCLAISQLDPDESNISSLDYCFNGQQYQPKS